MEKDRDAEGGIYSADSRIDRDIDANISRVKALFADWGDIVERRFTVRRTLSVLKCFINQNFLPFYLLSCTLDKWIFTNNQPRNPTIGRLRIIITVNKCLKL